MIFPNINFANWQFWGEYDPPNSLGEQKVQFDGDERLIIVNRDVTVLDFREDVYSAWKEWVADPNHDNAKYPLAITASGGDWLTGNRYLGTTYFLENGWRLRTWEGNHELTLTGNAFTRCGMPLFVPTINPWTITINLNTSSFVETIYETCEDRPTSISNTDIIAISDGVWNHADAQELIAACASIPQNVWDEIIDSQRNQTAREKLRRISTKIQDISLS